MTLLPGPRTLLAFALFSFWLAALFAGFAGGGTVHLLLLGGLYLFPWRRTFS